MARSPLGRNVVYLNDAIGQLRERMKPLNQISFTHDEFLSLFAPPEHWEILRTASHVANISASGGTVYNSFRHPALEGTDVATIRFMVSPDGAPLMPRNQVVLDSAPKDLVDRLTSWVNQEIETGYEFARARALMNWLDVNCDSKEQIRFLWPSLVTLCSVREETADLCDRLREFKPVRSIPSLPLEIREACKRTAGAIASAMLLEEPKHFSAPVTVSLYTVGKGRQEGALGLIQLV